LNAVSGICEDLYILGDLFAYWYEHPQINFENPALEAVKEFRRSGKNVYFVYGNRDFAAGSKFQEASGVNSIGDDIVLLSASRKILLTHGDKFAKKDIRYQIWKRLIRSPAAKFIFKSLPVGFAVAVADRLKNIGKNRPKYEDKIADMIVKGAAEAFEEYDDIVTGHAHFKAEREFILSNKTKRLYILPEFRFPGEVLLLKDGEFTYKYID